jgi:predicted CXXCH cytochrome family protein
VKHVRFLVRYHVERSGDVEYRDVDFEGSAITIGHGIDQVIKIPGAGVADEHAVIELKTGGKGRVKARTQAGVVVNNSTIKAAGLSPGDVITVGPSHLEVINPPAGFDFALASIRSEIDSDDYLTYTRFSTRIEQTRLSKRRWSWGLFLVLFIAGFVLPFTGVLFKPLQSVLQHIPVVNDTLWASGPVQTPHQNVSCGQCHSTAFVRVRDQQCLECHQDTGNHIDLQAHPVTDLQQAKCADCHVEHNEPSGAVRDNPLLCTGCHADPAELVPDTALARVTDFAEDHPEFKLTLLTPDKMLSAHPEWRPVRSSVTADLQETSNLRFPHDKHLDPAGVKSRSSPDGREHLNCSDCHQLDAGGQYMLPISMEQHCRRCHLLEFDADAPGREVPHGNPELARLTIEEYYSRKYLPRFIGQPETAAADNQPITDESESSGRRRSARPGGQLRRPGGVDPATIEELQTLKRNDTEAAIAELFAPDAGRVRTTICRQCHEVEPADAADPLSSWQIIPVKLTRRWMPLAEFNHYSHHMTECEQCHKAQDSKTSTDILMPTLQTCRDCHGGQQQSAKIISVCVMCHNFHHLDKGKMAVLQE